VGVELGGEVAPCDGRDEGRARGKAGGEGRHGNFV